MRWSVQQSTIEGDVSLPGDKSLAHRALLLSALATGTSNISNLPDGKDVMSTAHCLRALGVDLAMDNSPQSQDLGVAASQGRTGRNVCVSSTGTLQPPHSDLDAGNSGTSMRLLAGILAGQSFTSRLVGDASLSRRPMNRVVAPLTDMGARIHTLDGRAPLHIHGAELRAIDYSLPVPSAQVKSAILLAGLYADGETSVFERIPSRDHTERMMRCLGIDVRTSGTTTTLRRGKPQHFSIRLPSDPSSSAFFFAGAVLTGGSVCARGMCVNPTRTGFLRALERMGASVRIYAERQELGEPVADVNVSGHVRSPIEVTCNEVPALVDELPLLALVATQAHGMSIVRGAEELRVKESDRIAGVCTVLRALGADVQELPDGFVIRGPTVLRGQALSSGGDHRLAMMAAIAGATASGHTIIDGAEAASVSFSDFDTVFRSVGGQLARA